MSLAANLAQKEGFELVEIGFCALPANASQYLYVLQIQDFLKRKFYWMSMRVDRFYRGKGHFCGQIQVKDMCLRFSDCKTGNVSLYLAAIEHTAARQCLAAENRILNGQRMNALFWTKQDQIKEAPGICLVLPFIHRR